MMYRCDWCNAGISHREKMVCISRLRAERKPKRWAAIEEYFDSGHGEMLFHEKCFLSNAADIAEVLYPDGAPQPKGRTRSAEFPMVD